ncbi:YchJ family metal-binding protein [Geothermobacter hydrogeniphilus]|nr:YchJ family metal-binding protein [Geothermobacter hydrogeniphilus]
MTMRGCHSLPRRLVEERVEAFREGNFGFIYDSYHPDAPFLEQFPDREEYLSYAAEEIAGSCTIERMTILYERQQDARAEVVIQQLLKTAAGYQESFELVRLGMVAGGWKYLGSERIERKDFQGRPEDLRPKDFERVPNRFFF